MDENRPTTIEELYDDRGHVYYAVDNAKIIWTNFSGRGNSYNRDGKRNFNFIFPDPELAQKFALLEYNVKHRSVRDGFDGDEFDFLKVDISYETDKGQPIEEINPEWYPRIYLLDDNNYATEIFKDNLGELDGKFIIDSYFEFRPYPWKMKNGKSGTAAKLKRLFLKIKKDPLAGRFKFRDSEAIHPNDYTVLRSQEIRERNGQVPGGDDLPFDIP